MSASTAQRPNEENFFEIDVPDVDQEALALPHSLYKFPTIGKDRVLRQSTPYPPCRHGKWQDECFRRNQ